MQECYDVLIVGAGISGIGAAYRLQKDCPTKSFIILEGRSSMGGTWDLFKYPGIRSDSDMFTLGFSFNPWNDTKSLASGSSILKYIKDTAQKFGIENKIQYNHKVISSSWNDENKLWALTIAAHETVQIRQFNCKFLIMCSGYYSYESGYTPIFPGRNSFEGRIVHPQDWDETMDYERKKIIVIGSGATAVTLVPELAKKAEKVTMLQRSPTYMVSVPSKDSTSHVLRKIMPKTMAYNLSRWKNILFNMLFYKASKLWPATIKRMIKKRIRKVLGENYNMNHFNPEYKPWDQRICAMPDSDLFHAIKEGKVEIITDTIDRFTSKGILLSSGKELETDIIITATGLKIQLIGGVEMKINGDVVDTSQKHCYRGAMFSDVPNFAITVGYINASWTLKCDLNCRLVTKILNYMGQNNYKMCLPKFDQKAFTSEPFLNLNSGFILRAENILPKQGSKHPWKVHQNYVQDLLALKMDTVNDKYLEYC